MQPVDLEDVAIVGRPKTDNVAVVAVDFLEQGTQLRYLDGVITMSRRAQRGQSFAVRPVQQGQPYITLGDPFGIASRTMQAGDPIEEENLALELPKLEVLYRNNPPTPTVPELAVRTFDGYVRDDGSVGTRNYVGIVTSGMCSSTEAREIAWRAMHEIFTSEKFPNVDGVVAVVHESGCGMPDGAGLTMLNKLLVNTLRHPNLGSAIYLDLGCGKTCVECSVPLFQAQLPSYNQRVVNMTVQQQGGSRKTIAKGLETVEELLHYANKFARKPVPHLQPNRRHKMRWLRPLVRLDRESCRWCGGRHVREGRRSRAVAGGSRTTGRSHD